MFISFPHISRKNKISRKIEIAINSGNAGKNGNVRNDVDGNSLIYQ